MSVWWHVAGVLVIFAILFFVPDQHTSFGTIFSFSKDASNPSTVPGFINGSGFTSGLFGSTIYVFLIGLLLAQYTLTGYDASAHMTEETHQADVSGPRGIYHSVVISVIFGYILLLGVWYAVQGATGYSAALSFQLGDRERRGAGADLPGRDRQGPDDLHAADRASARSSSAGWRRSRPTRG